MTMVSPEIAILDVGHGNAAVLNHPRGVVIIDAGHGDTVLEYLLGRSISEIHSVLISHADTDHLGGVSAILAEQGLSVSRLFLNSDATKESASWQDLRVAVKDARLRAGLQVHTQLTTTIAIEFDDPTVVVEILAPSPEVAMSGVGGQDLDQRVLRSNTMSSVIRIHNSSGPLVLLPGDLDATGLANLLDPPTDLKAKVLVFPHHGGTASTRNLADFARQLVQLVEPDVVLFSIGRGLHGTPKPEVVGAIREVRPRAHIACTELSERCAANLPEHDPVHLSGLPARASARRACCAGSIMFPLDEAHNYLPFVDDHHAFIATAAPTALCLTPVPGPSVTT